MDSKKCTYCGEIKAEDNFNKDKHNKDGLDSRCRKCKSILAKSGYKKECIICGEIKLPGYFRFRSKICFECVEGLKIKECPKCKKVKSFDEYCQDKSTKYNVASWCKECNSKSNKKYRRAKLTQYRQVANKRVKRKRDVVEKYKIEKGCAKCGYKKLGVVLEFHHIDKNTKEKSIGNMIIGKLHKTIEEIDKCIVLCSNCHQEFHYYWEFKNLTLEEFMNE